MVEEGIFVSSVEPGSAAAVDDTVTVGDRLISVSSWFLVSHSFFGGKCKYNNI